MATPPTFSTVAKSTWGDASNASETTASLTWASGDVVVCVGGAEDGLQVMNAPTTTGAGLPSPLTQIAVTGAGGDAHIYAWSSTATGGGSGTIVSSNDGNTKVRVLAAWAISTCGGIGNTGAISGSSTTDAVISLIRGGANSGVVVIMGDWNAKQDLTVTGNPTTAATVDGISGTASGATFYAAHWTDQGVAGTTSYGIGSYTATPRWTGLAVEIKGSGTGVASTNFLSLFQ